MTAMIERQSDKLQAVDRDFFDILFAQTQGTPQVSEYEQTLFRDADQFLLSDKCFEEQVSMLPSILTRLISTIDSPTVDFIKVVSDLCEEPDVAREILVIANSDMYNSQHKEIRSIQHATSLIGLVSVAYLAATVMMSHVNRTKSSYFESFSNLSRKHSIQTAMACRDLAHQHEVNAFCSHLLGLINNSGLVYSFNCVSSKISENGEIGLQPNPWIYRQICSHWANAMTVEIAQKWALPQMMIDAIKQQDNPQSGLGEMLFLADLLSKVCLLVEHDKMNRADGISFLLNFDIPSDYIENFFDMAKTL